jgi:hypothetical protein
MATNAEAPNRLWPKVLFWLLIIIIGFSYIRSLAKRPGAETASLTPVGSIQTSLETTSAETAGSMEPDAPQMLTDKVPRERREAEKAAGLAEKALAERDAQPPAEAASSDPVSEIASPAAAESVAPQPVESETAGIAAASDLAQEAGFSPVSQQAQPTESTPEAKPAPPVAELEIPVEQAAVEPPVEDQSVVEIPAEKPEPEVTQAVEEPAAKPQAQPGERSVSGEAAQPPMVPIPARAPVETATPAARLQQQRAVRAEMMNQQRQARETSVSEILREYDELRRAAEAEMQAMRELMEKERAQREADRSARPAHPHWGGPAYHPYPPRYTPLEDRVPE